MNCHKLTWKKKEKQKDETVLFFLFRKICKRDLWSNIAGLIVTTNTVLDG